MLLVQTDPIPERPSKEGKDLSTSNYTKLFTNQRFPEKRMSRSEPYHMLRTNLP